MPPKPKIPPALEPELMKLAGEGRTSEDIAQWLGREHDIWITARQVRALVRRRRDELADVAKSVVRDEMRKSLLPAVRALRKLRLRARFAEKCAQEEGDVVVALKAQDRQLKAINLLFHYAGLNQPDQPGQGTQPPQDARAALVKRLRELVDAPEPGPKDPPIH